MTEPRLNEEGEEIGPGHLIPPPGSFNKGVIIDRELIEAITGQTITPEVFTVEPTGNLIHVVLEEVPDEWGHIKLPENLLSLEPPGAGYIMAAGPYAGSMMYVQPGAAPIGVTCSDPSQLLGLHVIFGSTTGMPLHMSILDRKFESQVLVMTSKDVRGIDFNVEPLRDRLERRSKE